jgi:hypothetical protein
LGFGQTNGLPARDLVDAPGDNHPHRPTRAALRVSRAWYCLVVRRCVGENPRIIARSIVIAPRSRFAAHARPLSAVGIAAGHARLVGVEVRLLRQPPQRELEPDLGKPLGELGELVFERSLRGRARRARSVSNHWGQSLQEKCVANPEGRVPRRRRPSWQRSDAGARRNPEIRSPDGASESERNPGAVSARINLAALPAFRLRSMRATELRETELALRNWRAGP